MIRVAFLKLKIKLAASSGSITEIALRSIRRLLFLCVRSADGTRCGVRPSFRFTSSPVRDDQFPVVLVADRCSSNATRPGVGLITPGSLIQYIPTNIPTIAGSRAVRDAREMCFVKGAHVVRAVHHYPSLSSMSSRQEVAAGSFAAVRRVVYTGETLVKLNSTDTTP